MDKARAELDVLKAQIEGWTAEKDALDLKIKAARSEAAEIETAIRIMSRFEHEDSGTDAPAEAAAPDKRAQPTLSNRDAVMKALAEQSGKKVGDLVAYIHEHFGVRINIKTAGNILWMLKNAGVAHRDGQKWYRVEQNTPLVGGVFN